MKFSQNHVYNHERTRNKSDIVIFSIHSILIQDFLKVKIDTEYSIAFKMTGNKVFEM